MSTNTPGASPSFGPLKQVDAGVLNVGYAEAGQHPAIIYFIIVSRKRPGTDRHSSVRDVLIRLPRMSI